MKKFVYLLLLLSTSAFGQGDFFNLLTDGVATFNQGLFSEDNPVVLHGIDPALRDQCIFEINDTTWGMTYAVGVSGDRLGVKYATAPKSDPHNWTKVNTYLIQSVPATWETDIEGMDVRRLSDGSWLGIYADEQSGKVGYATRAAGTFGAFTKYGSNPIIDNTSDTGAWNQYFRHATWIEKDGTYYMFYQANETAPFGPTATNLRIGVATSTDLVTWDLIDTPILQGSDFSSLSFLSYNRFVQPCVLEDDGIYYMSVVAIKSNQDIDNNTGFIFLKSTDLLNWELINTKRPFFYATGPRGSWETYIREEPYLFKENGNIHVYYNCDLSDENAFDVGYATLVRGVFNDNPFPPILSDNFNDDTMTGWTENETGGITVTEDYNSMLIEGDGSSQSLVEVLSNDTGWNSLNPASFSVAFDYMRPIYEGGDVQIGLSNAAGTNKIVFTKGGATTTIGMLVVIGGSTVYSLSQPYQGGSLRISVTSDVCSFWELRAGEWVNITASGDGWPSTQYVDISSWTADETIYFKVFAANDGTNPYRVVLNNPIVLPFNSSVYLDYNTGSEQTTAERVLSRLPALTSTEETAITNFVNAEVTSGNWALTDEYWGYFLNSSAANIGWKKIIRVANNATHVTNGYDFNGTDDYISTEFNMATSGTAWRNDTFIGLYLYEVGDQTALRCLFDAVNGSNNISAWQDVTNKRFRINKNTATNRTVTGLFANDSVLGYARTAGTSSDENLYLNGSLQSATLGGSSTAAVNDVLEIGRFVGGTNYFDGTIGFLTIGRAIGYDHSAYNTNVRALKSDLGL